MSRMVDDGSSMAYYPSICLLGYFNIYFQKMILPLSIEKFNTNVDNCDVFGKYHFKIFVCTSLIKTCNWLVQVKKTVK